MRGVLLSSLVYLGFVAPYFFSPEITQAAVITVVNLDGAGEGFNDLSPPDSASIGGGNKGATLGAQRLIAFQYAANIWGHRLLSPVEIRINASLNPLSCTAMSAVLGSAGAKAAERDFVGAPLTDTWYPIALANSLARTDLDPGTSDIQATFNSAIDTPSCPFPLVWYYGLDGHPPPGTLDFMSVVLHELGHGLGFVSFVDLPTGEKLLGFDDIFSNNLEDHSTGKIYPQMTDEERVAASQNSGNLHWVGANVVAASTVLSGGIDPSGHVQMYAPNPQEPSSSVSHFDTAVTPDELMEPFYTGANHDVRLTLELFADLGWGILLSKTNADFDGDGISDIGVFRDGGWYLDLNGNDQWDGCVVDGCYVFGLSGDQAVVGDWTGSGQAKIGIFRDGGWYLDLDGNGQWDGCTADDCYVFGLSGDIPAN